MYHKRFQFVVESCPSEKPDEQKSWRKEENFKM